MNKPDEKRDEESTIKEMQIPDIPPRVLEDMLKMMDFAFERIVGRAR